MPLLAAAGLYNAVKKLDLRAVSLIREGLAWHSPLADEVYALQALGSMPIRLGGSEALQARWLPAIDDGKLMCGFAMTEPDAGSDVGAMTTRATKDNGDWVLDGRKSFISNAGIADVYTVFASTDPKAGAKGISAFVVPADAPGLPFVGAQVMSAPHPLGRARTSSAAASPPITCWASRAAGSAWASPPSTGSAPPSGAAACGMAARALDEAVAHVKSRKQFGKPLAEFQLTQDADRARWPPSSPPRGCWSIARRGPRTGARSASPSSRRWPRATPPRRRSGSWTARCSSSAGAACMASHPVDRLYRAVRSLRIYEGTTEIQRLLIAREVLGGA